MSDTTRVVSLSAAKLSTKRAMNRKRPVFLWGPPGIGKSDLIQQIASDTTNSKVIDMRMALLEPTDLRGIPYYNSTSDSMKWAPPDDLPTPEDGEKYDQIILFLDELNSAPMATQASAYQLVLNRRIGSYKLPDNTVVVAAGNRESDKGVTYRMPSPLANRFIHLEIEPTFDDWQQWAIDNKIHPDVLGFLSNMGKHLLHKFEPRSAERAFPTPRSWAIVSDLLYDHDDDPVMTKTHIRDLICGTIGEGAALTFDTYLQHASLLPNVEDVLSGKVKDMPKEARDSISAQYSLVISMSYELQEQWKKEKLALEDQEAKTGKKIKKRPSDDWNTRYNTCLSFMMDNFEQEVTVMGARMQLVNYQLPIHTESLPDFERFHEKFGAYVMGAVDFQ